jgi:hypothetical protein
MKKSETSKGSYDVEAARSKTGVRVEPFSKLWYYK